MTLVPDRIVSISQPFVGPIVRGKAKAPVEFEMKLDISVVDGWTRLEFHSFDAYNEATKLQEMIEAFHNREGHYPSRILADKIFCAIFQILLDWVSFWVYDQNLEVIQ